MRAFWERPTTSSGSSSAPGGGLLAIATANVSNLLLVRAHARTREITVRRAMGAGTRRIGGQLLVESLVLAGLGGALGLMLARWILEVGLPLVPAGVLPAYAAPELSGRAFVFTLAVLALVGLAAGVLPAVSSARRELAGVLRTGRSSADRGRRRVHDTFVVTQVALALALLAGAGLLGRSFRAQLDVDPGLEVDGVHVLRVQPARDRYPGEEALGAYMEDLRAAVSAVPGVDGVALSSDFPFRGGSSGTYVMRADDPETLIRVHRHSVSPGFFELLGAGVVEGRGLTAPDEQAEGWRIVVSSAFADRVFPEGRTVVGQRVHVERPTRPTSLAEIVGVVENVRFRNLTQSMLDGPNSPDVFFVMGQAPSRTIEVSYRVGRDPSGVSGEVRRALAAVDPDTPPYAMASLAELHAAQTATPRVAAALMATFSLLALVLAAVGIHGVLTFSVGQRASEIAVRRVLGAKAVDVAAAVVAHSLKLTGVGLVVGAAFAVLGGWALEDLLFEVEPADPATLLLTTLAVLGTACVAAAAPATRAARRAPRDALGVD